mmetsp:Transcript_25956/g.36775  ORF Transcript_25956/g.36775 Transcript_25956/m.36775 type:complete len:444 (-) Transcript_25956:87-1418(-)
MDKRNKNRTFWKQFYSNPQKTNEIAVPSSFAKYVWQTYLQTHNTNEVAFKIMDLGCGNCRDSKFFTSKGNVVFAVDCNGTLQWEPDANPLWKKDCQLFSTDALRFVKTHPMETLVDCVYMRWFLHAVPFETSAEIFENAAHHLKPNGILCVEVRSSNDQNLLAASTAQTDGSHFTTHKRWLFSLTMCSTLASKSGLEVLELQEGQFSRMADAETPEPVLIRMVCRRPLASHFENSPNFARYQHIVPQMRQNTMISYHHARIMHNILEKRGVQYFALAGTLIGLTRHGGIIPWDNDIDIGFLSTEWKKLLSLAPELESQGLRLHQQSPRHWHFGQIDCFCMDGDKGSYFTGEAATVVMKSELKNVRKQNFGPIQLYAPVDCRTTLRKRYGKNWFFQANVNDNFHFKDPAVQPFFLTPPDRSFCAFSETEIKDAHLQWTRQNPNP